MQRRNGVAIAAGASGILENKISGTEGGRRTDVIMFVIEMNENPFMDQKC